MARYPDTIQREIEDARDALSATLDTLVAARPDTVIVEMGVPMSPPRGALHVATHGAARVCGQAAAESIAGS